MSAKPTVEVAFNIYGIGIDPEEITKSIGILPSRTWRLGDLVQSTKLCQKHDGWSLDIRRETYDCEALLAELLNTIQGSETKIRSIALTHRLELEISCAFYVREETPSCHLSLSVMNRMVSLGADLDIDIILLPAGLDK